ncbi:MAG: hypothetical protein RIT43_1751 [Bacteroidota bacterium]|jgi:hypothetical protein
MGHVYVKYLLKGKVVSNDEAEENKLLYDPRCFQTKQKNDAIMRLRERPSDVVLFIDEYFNLTLVEI